MFQNVFNLSGKVVGWRVNEWGEYGTVVSRGGLHQHVTGTQRAVVGLYSDS